jgi:hypothetical protein
MPRNSQKKAHQHVFFRGNFTIQTFKPTKAAVTTTKERSVCKQSKPKTNKQTHRENFVTEKSRT